MIDTESSPDLPPSLAVVKQDDGQLCVRLTGNWNLRSLATATDLQQKISLNAVNKTLQWDMRSVDVLDSAAALIIWQAWGEQMPALLQIKPEHQRLFDRWQSQSVPVAEPTVSHFSLFFNYYPSTDLGLLGATVGSGDLVRSTGSGFGLSAEPSA